MGRLDGDALLSAWSEITANKTAAELPMESADAILAGRLPWAQKDPSDRVIVTQALCGNLTVVIRDDKVIDAAYTPSLKA